MGINTDKQRNRWFDCEITGMTSKALLVDVFLNYTGSKLAFVRQRMAEAVWLPEDQIEVVPYGNGRAIVRIPFWLVREKGLQNIDLTEIFQTEYQHRAKLFADEETRSVVHRTPVERPAEKIGKIRI